MYDFYKHHLLCATKLEVKSEVLYKIAIFSSEWFYESLMIFFLSSRLDVS